MGITAIGWSNKGGTSDRYCNCGSWKKHWLNSSKESWPSSCSVNNCSNTPTLGGHIINPNVTGEKIAPMCDSCNKLSNSFDLKFGVTLVSANKADTCDK